MLALTLLLSGCQPRSAREVVVYTSQDQVYAEPILNNFEKQSGIKVRAVYDSEAVKTVGLANRLLAERSQPQCDLFWSNEEMRTRHLAEEGVFREENGWVAAGYRSRRLVVNANLVPMARAPAGLLELTNALWSNKVALAYPVFGTTAYHFTALRQHWGDTLWRAWCAGLARNKALIVDGNSVVVKLVGRGEVWAGLTDSDDIAAGQREGLPVAALPLNPELLLIPNTIAVIRQAPHPDTAQMLMEYLQRPATLGQLVDARALEGVNLEAVHAPTLKMDWSRAAIEDTTAILKTIFLR